MGSSVPNIGLSYSGSSPNLMLNPTQSDSNLPSQKIVPSKLFISSYKPVAKVSYMNPLPSSKSSPSSSLEITHIQPEPFEETFHIDESIRPLEFKTKKTLKNDLDDYSFPELDNQNSNKFPNLNNTEEYWTKPTLEEMKKMSDKQLSSLRGFKVGRSGYGEVEFLDAVNVLGANIDKEIIFTKMNIEVISKKINGHAVVTLLDCFPVSKKTGKRLTKKKQIQRFEEKLRNTESWNPDIHTIEYDNRSGVWVFEVPHFTK
jgi:hypothetical protein